MPATMLKNKVMYRQFIHSVAFCKLKMLYSYMFKTFLSLLSGHASYNTITALITSPRKLYEKWI